MYMYMSSGTMSIRQSRRTSSRRPSGNSARNALTRSRPGNTSRIACFPAFTFRFTRTGIGIISVAEPSPSKRTFRRCGKISARSPLRLFPRFRRLPHRIDAGFEGDELRSHLLVLVLQLVQFFLLLNLFGQLRVLLANRRDRPSSVRPEMTQGLRLGVFLELSNPSLVSELAEAQGRPESRAVVSIPQ